MGFPKLFRASSCTGQRQLGPHKYEKQWPNTSTIEARKLEYDSPPTPKPREEEIPAYLVLDPLVLDPYSNFLEPALTGAQKASVAHPLGVEGTQSVLQDAWPPPRPKNVEQLREARS